MKSFKSLFSCLIIPSTSFSRFFGNVTKTFCNPSDKTTHLRQMMNVFFCKFNSNLTIEIHHLQRNIGFFGKKPLIFLLYLSKDGLKRQFSNLFQIFHKSSFKSRGTLLVIIQGIS